MPAHGVLALLLMAHLPTMLTAETSGPSTVPDLPTLAHTARSDWMSVTDGCAGGPKAVGDGKTDDTAALQACFAAIGNMSKLHTVYLPKGVYVVKETLVRWRC